MTTTTDIHIVRFTDDQGRELSAKSLRLHDRVWTLEATSDTGHGLAKGQRFYAEPCGFITYVMVHAPSETLDEMTGRAACARNRVVPGVWTRHHRD